MADEKTLDRKRDYASIMGDDKGRLFEQDNLYFMGDGSLWVDPSAPTAAAPVAKAKTPAASGSAGGAGASGSDSQLDAQLKA